MKDESKPETSKQENLPKKRAYSRPQKPDFKRQESWRYKRVKESWRRPRGLDSKIRKKVKGWPQSPGAGYRTPKETRGLHPSGYEEVLVHNLDGVDKVNPETQAIRIAHTVGTRKRIEISSKASEQGVHLLNPIKIPEFEEAEEELVEEEPSEAPREEKEHPKTVSEKAEEQA